MKVPTTHFKLYSILKEYELAGKQITADAIVSHVGWKKSTLLTYLTKGQLSDFLNEVKPETYEISTVSRLTEIEFSKKLSQSKNRRGLGHNFNSRMAKALLRKSRDNMTLALELYNRPSLENRLDGFVILFCTAWEQLLKAELIERDGQKSIYKSPSKKLRQKKTITIHECLERIYDTSDIPRKNLERIIELRNSATHLLMPELQDVISRIFQSGLLNYVKKFEALTEQRFLETNSTGLLTLIGELRTPNTTILRSNYGEDFGNEILELAQTLETEINEYSDWEFAIPINISLTFAKKNEEGELTIVKQIGEGIEGVKNAIVIQKTKDHKTTHPYQFKSLIEEVNSRIQEKYDYKIQAKYLVNNQNGSYYVNSYCIQALLFKLKWKNNDNKFHYSSKNPEYHWYSEDAVEEIIKKIFSHPGYLEKARKDYSNRNRKK